MRALLAIMGLFFVFSCYALKIIELEEVGSFAPTYNNDMTLQSLEDMRLPVTSKCKAGRLKTHKVPAAAFSYPFFVVGDDAHSREWLIKNAKKLKEIHALGFVTNISQKDALGDLEALAGMPLLPVSVDELASLLHIEHYPFVLEEGVVWQ